MLTYDADGLASTLGWVTSQTLKMESCWLFLLNAPQWRVFQRIKTISKNKLSFSVLALTL